MVPVLLSSLVVVLELAQTNPNLPPCGTNLSRPIAIEFERKLGVDNERIRNLACTKVGTVPHRTRGSGTIRLGWHFSEHEAVVDLRVRTGTHKALWTLAPI